jgi:colanic acid/amylovoran biosynthesis protein
MPDKRPTICILGATFTTSNMGVSTLAAGTITCLLHRFPDADLFFLDYDKASFTQVVRLANRTVPVEFVNMRFSKKLYLSNHIAVLLLLSLGLKVIPLRKMRERLRDINRCLRRVHEADLVVSMSGGDSFSDIYGIRRFLYGTLPQVLVLFNEKRLVLLPQTLGPFRRKLSRLVARYILKGAEIVYSRDYSGVRNTKGLLAGNDKMLRFAYDVGFAVDARSPHNLDLVGWPKRPQGAAVVGLNVSGLLFMGGYTRDNMFGLRLDYKRLTYRLIDFLVREKKAMVLLVPHVFGTEEGSESDALVCKKLYEELRPRYGNNIAYVAGTYDQSEIKHVIGSCDFFIGARMHACIAALSQNIPAVAIAYSDKFIGVMETVGVESLVADARKMDEDAILKLIDEAYEQRNEIHNALELKMPQVKTQALDLFCDFTLPITGRLKSFAMNVQPSLEERN